MFFAGEVFPIPRFRTLQAFWPHPRFVNLYGPTETNVCTYYEVPADDSWQAMPTFPIGAHVRAERRTGRGRGRRRRCRQGTEGELVVARAQRDARLLESAGAERQGVLHGRPTARRWYRTGDIVTEDAGGQYRYLSRRDRMVKRRGYRVELGEIEVGLLKHPDVREAAVIAVAHPEAGVQDRGRR